MRTNHVLLTLTLLVAAPFARAAATVPSTILLSTGADPQNDDPNYVAGTKAMNESRWPDAVAAFDKVIAARGSRSDAAMYWKAYSLNKLGKGDLALSTCVQLRVQFTGSTWNRDCSALKLALVPAIPSVSVTVPAPPLIPPVPGGAHSHVHYDYDSDGRSGSDTDLKILALNSLMHRDPAQAVPILRNLLSSNQPPEIKRHALFVLAQSHSPEAQAAMRDLLLGKVGPEMQRSAIESAGLFEGRRMNDTLAEVYHSTADPKIKQAIISSFFISGDDVRLVELARSEKNLEMKRAIVSQLSLMNGKAATDYMMELLK